MLYTSSFTMMKTAPEVLTSVSISRRPPYSYDGLEFPPLFPTASLLEGYKAGKVTWYEYCHVYFTQLSCLHPEKTYQHLLQMAERPVLLCYEKDHRTCHRSLVALWFESNGFSCKELQGYADFKNLVPEHSETNVPRAATSVVPQPQPWSF